LVEPFTLSPKKSSYVLDNDSSAALPSYRKHEVDEIVAKILESAGTSSLPQSISTSNSSKNQNADSKTDRGASTIFKSLSGFFNSTSSKSGRVPVSRANSKRYAIHPHTKVRMILNLYIYVYMNNLIPLQCFLGY